MIFFKKIGEKIHYKDYNALVYLLRKFKKLSTSLQIGANLIKSKYGDFHFTDGFESIGNNFILKDDVTITSDSVLKNAFYSFIFTVLDVNLSGNVNKRNVKITDETGESGELELTIPNDLIEDNEVISPDFDVEVVFDEHEYYTPITTMNITLTSDKTIITTGETVNVLLNITNKSGNPITNKVVNFNVNGTNYQKTTDNNGNATIKYVGRGNDETVVISVLGRHINILDCSNLLSATFTGSNLRFGQNLITNGDVTIYWGDGTTSTINNPKSVISHNYSDGKSTHEVIFVGEIIGFGKNCFYNSGLKSIEIPNTITTLGEMCFRDCTSLTSVSIPNTITSLGSYCFYNTGLESIEIPNSVTKIGDNCFAHSKLKSVSISSSVTSLPSGCFAYTDLTSVSIPNGVSSLGDSCFAYSDLTSVSMPNSVVSIGDSCFTDTNLTTVSIPFGVNNIGYNCFYGCNNLNDYQLYWVSSPVAYNENKMPSDYNTIFTIPFDTIDVYINAGYPMFLLVEREE